MAWNPFTILRGKGPKTVLVTGANRGLGLEFVRQYAAQGWRVLACCRVINADDDLAQLAQSSPHIVRHALNLMDEFSIAALARSLQDQPIDLVVSNAGVYGPKTQSWQDFSASDALPVFMTNAWSPLLLAGGLHPNLLAAAPARFVQVSSRAG